jgi:hypothetical protein
MKTASPSACRELVRRRAAQLQAAGESDKAHKLLRIDGDDLDEVDRFTHAWRMAAGEEVPWGL